MEILSDSSWQFIITTIVGIIAIVAAVWIYLLQKNKKSLSYLIVASNELLTASEEIRGDVEILYNKMVVQNVHLLVVKFINDGNVPILKTDFEEQLAIHFEPQTQILSASQIEHSPESFNPVCPVHEDGHSLEVVPTLMNSQDTFTLKFLLAQYTKGTMKVTGRIVGVREITQGTGGNTLQRIGRVLFYLTGGSLIGGFITTTINTALANVFFSIFWISAILLFVVALFIPSPQKSKKND